MTGTGKTDGSGTKLSRRKAIMGAGVCFAMLHEKSLTAPAVPAPPKATFTKDAEANGMVEIAGIHQGKGRGKAKLFRFGGAPAPANFMIYDLPPGASEGVHVHFLDNRNQEGSFDEYYYVVSGRGQMEIDGEIVAVTQGDHVHTPLEVAHGIENTHPTENLRVFLTFIKRGVEPSPMRKPAPRPAGA